MGLRARASIVRARMLYVRHATCANHEQRGIAMKRSLVTAIHDSVIIGRCVVCGTLGAADLEEICRLVHKHHSHKIEEFYRMLGFENLRRHTDLVVFLDLEEALASCHDLPSDFFKAIGIEH